jgi:hypothetical protein
MVNMPGDAGMDMVHDKMHDAMDAPDMTGVEMADVALAHTAFHTGDMDRAQAYLEAAIGVQPRLAGVQPATVSQSMMPPTGAEPGNVLIDEPLDGVRTFAGGNLVALILSVLAVAGGAVLALRTRPRPRREA